MTHASMPSVLRVRVTALPGWHATVDGRAIPLTTWSDGAMLEARVPGGTHVVELHYWPDLFTDGLAVAAVVVVGLLAAIVVAVYARRRRPHSAAAAPGAATAQADSAASSHSG